MDNKKTASKKTVQLRLIETEPETATSTNSSKARQSTSSEQTKKVDSSVEQIPNLERFELLVQDIINFELAPKNTLPSLTRARVSALDTIRVETPAQALRLVNRNDDDDSR